MLDATLIKFVEPIGPGQIVDRESLVALPAGRIQMTIEVKDKEVTVRVLAMREESGISNENCVISSWNVSAYIWQNGQVIAAEKMEDKTEKENFTRTKTLPRISTVKRRRTNLTPRSFRFVRENSEEGKDSSVVDAILQICIFKYQSGGVQRKTFVGTVHIALSYLTSGEGQNADDKLACEGGWFKVFPKSTFLPGCPSSIAKTNCAISGQKRTVQKHVDEEADCRPISRSSSSVTFAQYGLKRSQSHNSSSSFTRSPECSEDGRPRVKTDPNPTVTYRIANWVKKTLLRQSSAPDAVRKTPRTPDSAISEEVFDMPPVIVGPRKRNEVCEPFGMDAIPETQRSNASSSTASTSSNSAKPDRLPIPDQWRPALSSIKKSKFRSSRSNNSSFDVGYESGRSRCLSSSDEETSHKSAESNLDVLCEKETEVTAVVHRMPPNEWVEMEIINEKGKIMSKKQRKPPAIKQRQSTLKRSARISSNDGFTSLNEIQRRGSRGSQDSAVFANA